MFNSSQIDALRTLQEIWSDERFVLIGASAVRLLTGDRSRGTQDLDLMLEVSLDRYPAGLEAQPGWTRHPKREHTWIGPGSCLLDIVPCDREHGATSLVWPETGSRMNLTGLRLAMDHAHSVEVAPGVSIRVATLEAIVLLKMVSFLDRPPERDRDLEDIAFLFDEYIGPQDNRRYEDHIFELGLQYDEISPFLLGKKLAEISSTQERRTMQEFMALIKSSDSTAQARMLALAPIRWRREPAELLLRIGAFERGFRSGHGD
jgi:predicted nucleotidyltransferase